MSLPKYVHVDRQTDRQTGLVPSLVVMRGPGRAGDGAVYSGTLSWDPSLCLCFHGYWVAMLATAREKLTPVVIPITRQNAMIIPAMPATSGSTNLQTDKPINKPIKNKQTKQTNKQTNKNQPNKQTERTKLPQVWHTYKCPKIHLRL